MGLLNAQQPEAPQAMPEQAAQQPEQSSQPQNKGEETYKRLGLAAMKIIYSKPESDHILEILRAGKDRPTEAVAQAAFAVIKRLQNDMKGIDPKLAFSVAPVLVALIFEIGMVSGTFQENAFSQDADPQKLIGETLSVMAKLERGQQGQPMSMPQQQAMGVQNGAA